MAAAGEDPVLRPEAGLSHGLDRRIQAAMLEVEREQPAHRLGLGRVDDEFATVRVGMRVIAKRGQPAHPEPFLLGGCNLVPDPFGGNLALELGEREQHIERQAAHG